MQFITKKLAAPVAPASISWRQHRSFVPTPLLLFGRAGKSNGASTATIHRPCLRSGVTILILVKIIAVISAVIYFTNFSATFVTLHRHRRSNTTINKNSSYDATATAVDTAATPNPSHDGQDYTMWSNEEAYLADCRRNMIGKQEWGDPLAPLVDKVEAKFYAQQWSPSVQVVPTIATFDVHNISLLTSDFLTNTMAYQQPYIIKPSHITGLVLQVKNNTLSYLKGSRRRHEITEGNINDDPGVYSSMIEVLKEYMEYDFSTQNGQTQYHLIPPRVVLEEYLPMDTLRDVTYWYIAEGKPIFVSMECADPKLRIYLTADYQPLLGMKYTSKPCFTLPPKPKSWERMRQIAEEEIGTQIPSGVVVRLDLYAGEEDVYFSEFTFSTNVCRGGYQPRVADGLLYAVNHGVIPSTSVTPDLVRNVILDTSWVPVFINGDITLNPSIDVTEEELATSFPSPVDLCLNMPGGNYQGCIDAAKTVAQSELRCIVHEERDNVENSAKNTTTTTTDVRYRAMGALRSPTLASVWSRVPQDKIMILLLLFCLASTNAKTRRRTSSIRAKAKSSPKMKETNANNGGVNGNHHYPNTNTTNQYNLFRNNIILYHLALVLYMYYTSENDGMFSSHSLTHLIQQSFHAFRIVHPITSPMIILSHFATYWLNIAAWTAPSLQSLFLRQFLAELIPPLVNEYTHHTEVLENVRCMRIVFIDSVQRHVLDEVIRGYFLPQFFVYFYLLPKFVMHHMGLLVVTGDSFMAVFAFQLVVVSSVLSGFWLLSWHRKYSRLRLQLPF